MSKRRQYMEEFKITAVKQVSEQGCQLSEVQRRVNLNELSRWKKAAETVKLVGQFRQKMIFMLSSSAEKGNHRLLQEREIFKKVAAQKSRERDRLINTEKKTCPISKPDGLLGFNS